LEKTHYFYWGFTDSGKEQMNRLTKTNSRVLGNFTTNYIYKTYTQVHIHGDLWDDLTFTEKLIHNNKGLKTVSRTRRKIYEYHGYTIWHRSTIFDQYKTKKNLRRNSYKKTSWFIRNNFTEEEVIKYSDWKYHDTSIYYQIAKRNPKVRLDANAKKKKIFPFFEGYDLKENIDEIIEDIDVCNGVLYWDNYFEPLIDVCKRKNAVNIIPYKVDLVDNFTSKLDGFFQFIPDLEYMSDLFEVYETNKKRVWNWLDYFSKQQLDLVTRLKRNNIKYEYFNLDEDNYSDFFPWVKNNLPRNNTHRSQSWIYADDSEKWKWKKCQDIAKEYIIARNIKPLVEYD